MRIEESTLATEGETIKYSVGIHANSKDRKMS